MKSLDELMTERSFNDRLHAIVVLFGGAFFLPASAIPTARFSPKP